MAIWPASFLRLLRDPVQRRLRPHDQAAPQDRRRRERHLAQRILANQPELGPGLNHEGIAVFAQQEDLAVVSPRRSREAADVARDPLPPVNLFAGSRVVTEQEAAIEKRVVIAAVDEG